MKTKIEYPASHSVDTDWYAIDSHGHLALMCSGEEGLLPAEIEPGESEDDGSIIEDALTLNSSLICDGCRRLVLSKEQMECVLQDLEHENLFSNGIIHVVDGKYVRDTAADETSLFESVLELAEGVRFSDLAVWKERTNREKTRVFEISDDHRLLYCRNLKFEKGTLNRDVDEGRIIGEGWMPDDMFECLYYPSDTYSEKALVSKEVYKSTPPLFAYSLPEGFHGLRKIDVDFSTAVEFDMDDHMGMYICGLEECGSKDDQLLIWPDYSGHSEDQLRQDLYDAIMRHRSRSVWCLLNRYGVRPDVFFDDVGKTAMQLAIEQYEQNKETTLRLDWPSLSCYRILKMMQLKDRQLCSR